MKFRRPSFPLHIHLSLQFLLIIAAVGGLIASQSYRLSVEMLETSAADLTARINRETLAGLKHIQTPAEMAVNLLRHDHIAHADSHTLRMRHLNNLREVLDNAPGLFAIYVGYGTGDFFYMRRFSVAGNTDPTLHPPPDTAYMVQSIDRRETNPDKQGRFVYLDRQLTPLSEEARPDYAARYNPVRRDWYVQAKASQKQVRTAPYMFFSSGKMGVTLATRTPKGDAVVGADFLLETINQTLGLQKVTPSTQVVLTTTHGDVLACENFSMLLQNARTTKNIVSLPRLDEVGIPVLSETMKTIQELKGEPVARNALLEIENRNWRVSISPLLLEDDAPLYLITAIPERELLAAAITQIKNSAWITLLAVLATIPLTWLMARGVSRSLRKLVVEAEAIQRFDFSHPAAPRSPVNEVNDLAVTMDGMKRTIRRFMEISQAVAEEDRFEHLLPRLLAETIAAAEARSGVLYLASDTALEPANILLADGSHPDIVLPTLSPEEAVPLMDTALASGRAHAFELQPGDIEPLGLLPLMRKSEATSAITMPLVNRKYQLVGVLVLLLSREADPALLNFVGALSGSATVSLENQQLIKAEKELFEAFIRLIADAIDAKSPYTGGHCVRVPELTKMLARAACAQTDGPFRQFSLSEEDWEAVHVASWLHDCGKVITPEYVVDKATKLETIYDRIHEVRMRFEVLKRDAEIACWKAISEGADRDAEMQKLREKQAQIDDDFAFVGVCNIGGEFMAPEKLDRLRAIAAMTWTRTLDDRIGISHEELRRKSVTPAAPLPAQEPLLADRPEHVFARRAEEVIAEDNPWGIQMQVPEALYNRGELHNLSVVRGTLSEEERYKINEHIVQTLRMLAQLPFPKHLRQVPELAGAHHEKMDGTGYPRRLLREEMSPVARMMAIADIFEALTAVDRPYKKGKTLSEAIKIMSFMKKDKHIDPDLFELFLRSGVHLEYAKQFMKPEQIDEVDIEAFLA